MNLFKQIWIFMRMKPPKKSSAEEVLEKPNWNIYQIENKKSVKQLKFFHYFFKYKFFVPVLYIAQRLLKDFDIKVVDTWYNKNIRIFASSWNEACRKWGTYYCLNKTQKADQAELDAIMNGFSMKFLKTICKIIVLFMKLDASYRDFGSIFMYELTMQMNKDHPKNAKYLFYNSMTIQDVNYYMIGQALNDPKKMAVFNISDNGKEQKITLDLKEIE